MIPLHIGFGVLIESWLKGLKKDHAKVLMVIIVITVLLFSIISVSYRTVRQDNIEPLNMKFIEDYTNTNAVILTDDLTGFAIPGLTGRKIVTLLSSHGEMFIKNKKERNTAMKTFSSPNTTEENRTEILYRYNISYVLINKDIMNLQLPYPVEYEDNKYLLYNVTFR